MQQTLKKIVQKKPTKYVSKPVDAKGYVKWDKWEDEMWAKLYKIQSSKMEGMACEEFIQGLKKVNFPEDRVPQLPDVSDILEKHTGFRVEPVPALIPFEKFFRLLADRKFPSATFIRTPEEMLYLEEPDIFHELYGHCPLLTNKDYADFTARYGKLGVDATPRERVYLARLYWFTVEFGLIKPKDQGMRIYGGGILSSIGETDYSLKSDECEIRRLNMLDAFRTPYRIDIKQKIYYYIEDLKELQEMDSESIMFYARNAMELGLYKPSFPPKPKIAGLNSQQVSNNMMN